MEHSHDGPLCASLGHFVGTVTFVWCPHQQAYSLYVRAGDDRDDISWRCDSVQFGPFDGPTDVEQHALGEVRRLMRADRAGWAATQQRPRP